MDIVKFKVTNLELLPFLLHTVVQFAFPVVSLIHVHDVDRVPIFVDFIVELIKKMNSEI